LNIFFEKLVYSKFDSDLFLVNLKRSIFHFSIKSRIELFTYLFDSIYNYTTNKVIISKFQKKLIT